MEDHAHRTDPDLIERCLAGDRDAWGALVRRYQRLIASITFKFRLEPEDSADVFQSVCFALLQQLPNLRKQAKLSSWIITVSVREAWRLREAASKVSFVAAEDHDETRGVADSLPEAEADLIRFERQHAVRAAVESLPEPCRRLMNLLFYQPQPPTYVDIGKELGMPAASIGPNRARCLEKLKTILRKSGFSFPACISSTNRRHT